MGVLILILLLLYQARCAKPVQRDANDIACAASKRLVRGTCCSNVCCDTCKAGMYVVDTCRKGVSAICGECPPGSFSSGVYGSIRCTKCGQCDNTGHIQYRNCTASADTVCPCSENQFLTSHLKCVSCAKCGPGFGVKVPCQKDSDTECQECPGGYFSNNTSLEKCQKCSTCRKGTKVVTECGRSQDNVCHEDDEDKISTKIFIWVVVSLCICVVALFAITLAVCFCRKVRKQTPPQPLLSGDSASEAQCRGSSVSSLDQTKKCMTYIQGLDGQSISTRSSLCSERPRLMHPNVRLSEVSPNLIQKIGFHLNPSNNYRDWEGLAGLLGYTQLDIKNFRLAEGRRYAEAMLEDFWVKKPKVATVGFLFDKIIEVEREDVADLIVEYDKKISSERTETPV